ncbi:hypothetical protein DFA_01701 [Cavenderia fasciculata]|uniref:Uncharacterized protein n=1 Tax=Cavenderia fasciculata TaxID=261658 RepID=F4PUA0_CACFS|nr:uncharacterized protein DFA_01701 [Cavenderia fasciculata]EGG21815.1 hypothetical protein DFA_01701 [Cavenderia fasciculata]|eukprot:XP_004359665.1 hypothetical protein DFA_01701 [Cavenderia fasciculata]
MASHFNLVMLFVLTLNLYPILILSATEPFSSQAYTYPYSQAKDSPPSLPLSLIPTPLPPSHQHIPDHYVPPVDPLPVNENYTQFKCPIRQCDPGIVCRNMFGNVQCVSQYDAFLLISFKKTNQWKMNGDCFCKYDGLITNLNSIKTTTFSVKVNWIDRLLHPSNSSHWGFQIHQEDDPSEQILHLPEESVLDQIPHPFGFIIQCPEGGWVPSIIFKTVEFTTIPPIISLSKSIKDMLNIGSLNFNDEREYTEDFHQQGGLVY